MIAAGLMLAYVFGLLAHRLRIQPLVGYLVAGIIVGPFTPGFTADAGLAAELAEIGIILLMFGVGLHFSLKDLMSVARIVVPGTIIQIVVATLMGAGLGRLLGWSWQAGLVFGLALSVASTVVMVRAFQERRLLDTERGRIAVGWLVVEDLIMVLTLVLLPTAAMIAANDAVPLSRMVFRLLVTLVKVSIFVAVMLVIGRRVIPWLMHYTAHTGSRELFRLAVYAIAIGVAFGAAKMFDVSFALGAFFAGMVMGESNLSQRCRCATPSRCCSSYRSACCSIRTCSSKRHSLWRRPSRSSSSARPPCRGPSCAPSGYPTAPPSPSPPAVPRSASSPSS